MMPPETGCGVDRGVQTQAAGPCDENSQGEARGEKADVHGAASRVGAWVCIALIRGYQVTLGPWLGGHCRFHPSCSVYAIEAYRTHGAMRGTWLTVRRLARCHPLGGKGFDPVPGRDEVRK